VGSKMRQKKTITAQENIYDVVPDFWEAVQQPWTRAIIVLIVAAVFTCLLTHFTDFFNLYFLHSLNSNILQFGGVLLGLLLTAYAIFFGLIPEVEKDILKTDAFEILNKVFAYALTLDIVIIIISLFIFFLDGIIQRVLILLQIWLLFIIIFWSATLIEIIYFLFVYMRAARMK